MLLAGPPSFAPRRRFRAYRSGAAIVESLLVLPVLTMLAMNALEFSRYAQVRMLVRYAQVQGLRECSVSGDHEHNPTGNAQGNEKAKAVVKEALKPWEGKWLDSAIPGCDVRDRYSESSPVYFPLSATYKCSYALSFCKAMSPISVSGPKEPITGAPSLSMPVQTALYDKHNATSGVPTRTPCPPDSNEAGCRIAVVGDAGAPPNMAVCTSTITAEQRRCSTCAGLCSGVATCLAGCDDSMRSALQRFSSGSFQCRPTVDDMKPSTCGLNPL